MSLMAAPTEKEVMSSVPEQQPKMAVAVNLRVRFLTYLSGFRPSLLLLTEVQFLFYLIFLICFTKLAMSCRDPEDIFFSNNIRGTYITKEFDSDESNFNTINRIADFWDWTQRVLVPGLGLVHQADDRVGLLGYTTEELRYQSSYTDVVGIQFRQLRVKPMTEKVSGQEFSYNPTLLGYSSKVGDMLDKDPFGGAMCAGSLRFWRRDDCVSLPADEDWKGFKYYDANEINALSFHQQTPFSWANTMYPGGGYVSFMVPFYSSEPLHNGTIYRGPSKLNRFQDLVDKGIAQKYYSETAKYRCLRVSLNGEYVSEVCDSSPNEQKCLGLASQFVVEMKKLHWMDQRTRFVHITVQMRSSNLQMDATLGMYLEFPGDGGILPSYLIDHSPNTSGKKKETIRRWRDAVICFIVLQLVEEMLESHRAHISEAGIMNYFRDFWNVLDAVNLVLMIVSIHHLNTSVLSDTSPDDGIYKNTGYISNAHSNNAFQLARVFLAVNCMLHYLKIIKFLAKISPTVGLVLDVLRAASNDLLTYMLTVSLATVSVAWYMFVVIGDKVADFYNPHRAIFAIVRSIYGNADFGSVDRVTPSNTTSALYMAYLCVIIWIVITVLVSILEEAQQVVRSRMEIHEVEFGKQVDPLVAYCHKFRSQAQDILKKCTPRKTESTEINGRSGACNIIIVLSVFLLFPLIYIAPLALLYFVSTLCCLLESVIAPDTT
jgi:hypothetical protein